MRAGPEVLFAAFASLGDVTTAVLSMNPQWAVVVTAVNVMVRADPGMSVPKLHVSVVPPATGDAGTQAPASAPPTVQVKPIGSVSV